MTTLLDLDIEIPSKLYYNPSNIINGKWFNGNRNASIEISCSQDTNGLSIGSMQINIMLDNKISNCVGTFFVVEDGLMITFMYAYEERKSYIDTIDMATGKIFFDESNKLYLQFIYTLDRPKEHFLQKMSTLHSLCDHENMIFTKV